MGPPRHARQGPAAVSGVEGGAGQQPGRVQHRQGRGVGRHQERDLGAHQAHRVTAPCRQPLDDAGVLPPRAFGEDAVHQFGEDDLVEDGAVLRGRQFGGYPPGGEGPGVDRAVHGVLRAEQADPRWPLRAAWSATTSAMCRPGSARLAPGCSRARCAVLSGQAKKSAPARASRCTLTDSVARTAW